MEQSVLRYFTKGLAPSTLRTYKSGQDRYLKFCESASLSPLPANEEQLCAFVAFLADDKLKHRSIKTYMSAVRHLQIRAGFPDPFAATVQMPRLEYVLRGVKRSEAEKGLVSLPITPHILRQLWEVRAPEGQLRNTKLIWAASTLCFFAFLRAGELCTPSTTSYNPNVHLSMCDITVDDPLYPSVMQIFIKQSKTDPFRKGFRLSIGQTGTKLCPVAAMLDFLAVRGTDEGPVFTFRDGSFLTRQRFVELVRAALRKAGVDQSRYCGHSFRIGAAAQKVLEDCMIKTLGRWESVAYLQYVKIPRDQLAGYSKLLAS